MVLADACAHELGSYMMITGYPPPMVGVDVKLS